MTKIDLEGLDWKIKKARNPKELETYIDEAGEMATPLMWLHVCESDHLTNDLIKKYDAHMDWRYLSAFRDIPERMIEDHVSDVDWYSVSSFRALTMRFIKKYIYYLSLDRLIYNDRLQISDDDRKWLEAYYEKAKDKKEYKAVWDGNLAKSPFCPKDKKIEILKRLSKIDDEYLDLYKQATHNEREIAKKQAAASTARPPKFDFGKPYSRDDMAKYLKSIGVRVMYHDTMDDLRKKIADEDSDGSPRYFDFSTKYGKADLRKFIESCGVRVFYHDTMDVLEKKAHDLVDGKEIR
jgi:hypothetical protein